MLNSSQCMAFTWKTFRSRFLRQFLWVGATREDKGKTKDPGPPSAGVSTSILAKAIADIEGEEQYQGLMSDTAQCYKRVNSQASAPLDVTSSLSAQEESASSSTEGEGARQTPPLLSRSLPHGVSPSRLRLTYIMLIILPRFPARPSRRNRQ